jgi:hypothetical protein
MYYYLLSTIIHWDEYSQKNDINYPHAKKNILIFMIGSVAYLFTAGFLYSKQYSSLIYSILPLSIMKDFFLWFLAIDVISCFILFKIYWGWGLLTELDGILDTKKINKQINVEDNKVEKPSIAALEEFRPIEHTQPVQDIIDSDKDENKDKNDE